MSESIFQIIRAATQLDGSLPPHFDLPESSEDDSSSENAAEKPHMARFAPGAKDGISIYHFGVTPAPDVAKEVARIIKKDCKKSGSSPSPRLLEIFREHSALSLIDDLLDELSRDMRGIILSNFADYACRLVFDSSDRELVKLGISLMGMLSTEDECEITRDLLILAAFDEFTLYVVIALQNRTDTDTLVWQIARTARGWGKIHAVERLEPATSEIREWILRDGLDNEVMNAYLALTVAEKGRLIETLRLASLENELFESVTKIMEALLDEGPVSGISVYEDREEAISHFLRHVSKRTATPELLRAVRKIYDKLPKLELPSDEAIKSQIRDILR